MGHRIDWMPPPVHPLFEPAVTINAPSAAKASDVEKARQKVADAYRLPVQMVESRRVKGVDDD